MPQFDGTGPQGRGPMTGWGRGPCGAGQGFGRRGFGRGPGFGRGLGRGFGPGFRGWSPADWSEPVALSKEEQKKILEAELAELQKEREAIEAKLKEL